MNEAIPQLHTFDEPALEAAFATLAEEVRTADTTDLEAFRLHWLGRKQGRLKLISEAWLKSAPPEAKKALGIRFNQLKQQIEAALESPATKPTAPAGQGIDITLPGTVRAPGIPHPLLKTMHEIVRSSTTSATPPTSARKSNPTSTTSKPSTSPPTTPPATPRTPSSSPTSSPAPRATACSCALTPAPSRSAP